VPFDREQIEARLALDLIASADMPQIAQDIRDWVTSVLKDLRDNFRSIGEKSR
jgi:hypothetical protein